MFPLFLPASLIFTLLYLVLCMALNEGRCQGTVCLETPGFLRCKTGEENRIDKNGNEVLVLEMIERSNKTRHYYCLGNKPLPILFYTKEQHATVTLSASQSGKVQTQLVPAEVR